VFEGVTADRKKWLVKKLSWSLMTSGSGEETVMAKLIEFYIPENYRKQTKAWTPPELRGKIIVFTPGPHRKSA
jgi:hypothetical protein